MFSRFARSRASSSYCHANCSSDVLSQRIRLSSLPFKLYMLNMAILLQPYASSVGKQAFYFLFSILLYFESETLLLEFGMLIFTSCAGSTHAAINYCSRHIFIIDSSSMPASDNFKTKYSDVIFICSCVLGGNVPILN